MNCNDLVVVIAADETKTDLELIMMNKIAT
jgi:hypothetical protein